MEKPALRKHYLALRSALILEQTKIWSERIIQCLEPWLAAFAPDHILGYFPLAGEPDITPLAGSATPFSLPVTNPKDLSMTFKIWSPKDPLTRSRFGLMEPTLSPSERALTSKTVILVPGLAFSPTGVRLGFGAGYYDRFLARQDDPIKIGVTFSPFIAQEIPSLPHDIPVSWVVTEQELKKTGL